MSITRHHQEKGTTVIHLERSSRTPSSGTGLFATLRGALRSRGSGAPTRRLVLSVTLATVSALTIVAAPAFAVSTHVFSTDFAGGGSGAGQVALSSESGVAVSSASHDVYVADTGNFRVDQFTSSGGFVRAWGWGVGDGLPMFETCTLACQAGVSGSGAGQFTKPTFIAVDNSAGASKGDVYVGDMGDGLVSKFSSEGVLLESWGTKGQLNGSTATAGSFGSVYGVAVDGSGALAVINSESRVFKFAQDASFIEELTVARGTAPDGLAADTGGDLFKANGEPSVEEINPAGGDIGQVTRSVSATGLAVQSATGDLYVDEGGDIEHYAFSAPGVVSEQGGTTCNVEPSVGCAASDVFGIGAIGGGAGIAVDSSSDTAYVADNASQRIDVFTGPVLLPDATTETPTVSETTATLKGTVNPDGTEVKTCVFEYGAAPGVFSATVPCAPTTPYNGTAPLAVSAELDGLTMFTTYHYRLAVTNANGTNRGSEVSFTTPGPPSIANVTAQVNPSEKAGQTSATLNAQIDPGGSETTYRFEYGETTAYGTNTPLPDGTIPPSRELQPVPTAELSGLKLGTVYHYRLVAHNQYGTATSPDQEFRTLPAALLTASVSDVTATSASLEAQINPLGNETTYSFQYGTASCTTSSASCTSTPVPAGDIGAGETEVQVPTVQLRGLLAGTTYHYRVIATNSLGTVLGPEQTFITQTAGTSTLPDGRQWELVSPVDKRGGLLEPSSAEGVTQASASGDAISYLARTPTESEPAGNANYTQVLSTRGSASWGSRDITSPREVPPGALGGDIASEYRFFSQDLATSIVQPLGPFTQSLSPEASEQTPFLRTDFPSGESASICSTSCYRPLVTGKPGVANVPPGTVFGEAGICVAELVCGPRFQGASADGSHVVLSSGVAPLVEGAVPTSLYEWVDGQLQIVNVLPQDEGGGTAEGAALGGEASGIIPVTAKAVSRDGSRVVWSTGGGGGQALYVRDLARNETVRLNAGGNGESVYQTASADGGRVFFTQNEELYVFESTPGTELSAGHTTQLTSGGKVIGLVAGISEDGATVYFVGNGVLTNTPNAQGETAAVGDCIGSLLSAQPPGALCDLYELRAGVTKLVAVLSGEDDARVWTGTLKGLGWARTSGNGQWMTFMSTRPLTGYDNRDAIIGTRDTEVFLYDAAGDMGDGQLVCVSCNPANARPHGLLEKGGAGHAPPLADVGGAWDHQTIGGILPGWTSPLHQPRYLSDSGRVLFDSFDALVPSDTNNTGDVYQYEPPGVGSCKAEGASFVSNASGCVGLLSSGTGGEAAFLDASESGDDVFFLSPAQLVSQDVDTIPDVYDARVAGGFPLSAPVPACEGDACQSMVAAPNDATPGSLAFHGPGNVKPPVVAPPAKRTTKRTAAQIRVEKLAKALHVCRKKHGRKRAVCERQARKRYGVSRASRTTTNRRAGR